MSSRLSRDPVEILILRFGGQDDIKIPNQARPQNRRARNDKVFSFVIPAKAGIYIVIPYQEG